MVVFQAAKALALSFLLFPSVDSTLAAAKKEITTDFRNCSDTLPKQGSYSVIVTERDAVGNGGASLISKINGSSEFQYNFAAAWFPAGQEEGLIVRVVDPQRHPEWTNAGALAVVTLHATQKPFWAERVTSNGITWAGAPDSKGGWGAADPRIVYRPANQLYYLTWDNCTQNCWPQRITYLSTTTNPLDANSWKFHGAAFPFSYTSGAALLFRDDQDDDGPHLAFVCNSNTADTIFIAESHNGIQWTIPKDPSRRILMTGRPGCWDSHGVAVGPQPERLSSTGDYLLIYNSDTGWPYHPNPLGRCAIGWAILDGADPTHVVARSQGPLLTATRPWETCKGQKKHDPSCQEPMVVFATGLKPTPNTDDEFFVIYGGADTVVAVSKIKVHHPMKAGKLTTEILTE
mmetsp:Transcript_22140/g.33465  ORF Transcript_22140/g.33465 Transcript_22140/m.33465 type:complete len:403 (-) Transcript_22140:93-1301(-)